MDYICLDNGTTYASWIKLEEEAERIIKILDDLNVPMSIEDADNVPYRNVLIFDNTIFNVTAPDEVIPSGVL